jgi:hypothetical protein
MSTTPTDPAPGGERSGLGGYAGRRPSISSMPVPFNSELLVWLFVWIVIALIWIISDRVDAAAFATYTVALTFAYLISRGIAKASRVYEREQEPIGNLR